MAGLAAPPQANDLLQRLQSAGLIATPSTELNDRLQTLCDAAWDEFQHSTGWDPWLPTAGVQPIDWVEETLYFNPPGPIPRTGHIMGYMGGGRKLDLGTGLITLTSLYIGYSPTQTGTPLDVNVDFWLQPLDAARKEHPYTWIDFRVAQWGQPRSIAITGVWGHWTTVPAAVWQSVLDQAYALVVPDVQELISGGMVSWREQEAAEEYRDRLNQTAARCAANFAATVRQHKMP